MSIPLSAVPVAPAADPRLLSLPHFIQLFRDSAQLGNDMRFCFILGSGASVQSGVPTGERLVNEWLKSLFEGHCPGENHSGLQAWAEKEFACLPGFTWERRAEYYGHIYARRFPENASGQSWLRQLMQHKLPSFGYSVLARILSDTRHNLVITTNFDNLVHDALIAHGQRRSFIAHSAADARFILNHQDKPRILKLHGDIDRETYNATALIDRLADGWTQPLLHLLGAYTPIFLGYGGCDPGFMDFLNKVYASNPARVRPIWAYRVDPVALRTASHPLTDPPGRPDTSHAREFATRHQSWWLPTPGFDELMLLLAHTLGIPHSGKQITDTAERIRDDYQANLTAALKSARAVEAAKWCPQLDILTRMAEEHLLGAAAVRRWPEWLEYIEAGITPDEQITRVGEAIAALPDDPRPLAFLSGALFVKSPAASAAQNVMDRAEALCKSKYPEDSEESLYIRHTKALQTRDRGNLKAAVEELREVIKQRAALHGDESPQVLESRNALAIALDVQGKNMEAEAEHRAVLTIRERTLGPEHPDAIASRNNLATSLQAQGKYQEAEAENRNVLAISERVFGPEHPRTLGSRSNLATILSDQGKYAEAEAEHRAVLAIQERILGSEDPDTLASRNNLAGALQEQGCDKASENEHRTILSIRERVQGPGHPQTLTSRNNVAVAMAGQGRYAEAEAENRSRIPIEECVLGKENPITLKSRFNLATVLQEQGKFAEAEAEHRAVLAIRERVHGPEQPDTLDSRHNLANTLWAQGKHEEAEAEHRIILAIRERKLGSEHPDTLNSRNSIAVTLGSQKKYAAAETELRAILEIQLSSNGAKLPPTHTTFYNLALSLAVQDRFKEARVAAQAALEGRERTFGKVHADTAEAKELLEKIDFAASQPGSTWTA